MLLGKHLQLQSNINDNVASDLLHLNIINFTLFIEELEHWNSTEVTASNSVLLPLTVGEIHYLIHTGTAHAVLRDYKVSKESALHWENTSSYRAILVIVASDLLHINIMNFILFIKKLEH